jgi:hypothetical protein
MERDPLKNWRGSSKELEGILKISEGILKKIGRDSYILGNVSLNTGKGFFNVGKRSLTNLFPHRKVISYNRDGILAK